MAFECHGEALWIPQFYSDMSSLSGLFAAWTTPYYNFEGKWMQLRAASNVCECEEE